MTSRFTKVHPGSKPCKLPQGKSIYRKALLISTEVELIELRAVNQDFPGLKPLLTIPLPSRQPIDVDMLTRPN